MLLDMLALKESPVHGSLTLGEGEMLMVGEILGVFDCEAPVDQEAVGDGVGDGETDDVFETEGVELGDLDDDAVVGEGDSVIA